MTCVTLVKNGVDVIVLERGGMQPQRDRPESDRIRSKVKAGHLFFQMGEVRLYRVSW